MTLTSDRFGEFFVAAHGKDPYLWQQRLLNHVCREGRWPEQIVAPTGAGKTAVIDVHLFAVAVMAASGHVQVPRRLALVVDRRALTDSQYNYAADLTETLHAAAEGTVLGEVASALRGLRWAGSDPDEDAAPKPVLLGRLRGGAAPAREWRDEPAACAVLCATPAMWGSRLLFRGYGSTRYARPREAGLLAMDTVAVVDEAHLSGQLVTTARRVAELSSTEAERIGVPGLQVTAATATAGESASGWTSLGVLPEDVESVADQPCRDPALAARVCTDKKLELEPLSTWPLPAKGAARNTGIRRLAELTLERYDEFGATACCYVNNVETALDVAEELRRRRSAMDVGVFCGRMRPYEAEEYRVHLPLSGHNGAKPFDVVVTTQTLEVGVDCDFSAGVSELATGSAVAQRAGRIGRSGCTAALTIVVPENPVPAKATSGPYTAADLNAAHSWLRQHTELAPWSVAQKPPPQAGSRRILEQRIEPMNVDYLARTGDFLGQDHEVALWLAEDFDTDPDIGVVVRTDLPSEPDAAVDLIEATPVQDHEVFPARLNTTVRKAIEELGSRAADDVAPMPLLVREGDVSALEPDHALKVGDIVVVDSCAALFRSGVVAPGAQAETVPDVLEAPNPPKAGEVVFRLGDSSLLPRDNVQRWLDEAGELEEEDQLDTRDGRAVLAELLGEVAGAESSPPPSLRPAIALLGEKLAHCAVTLHRDSDDEPSRLIVRDLRSAGRDEDTRQTWTPADEAVALHDHNSAVGTRARELAHTALQLPEALVHTLETAGRHHDDGKNERRFQRFLGAVDEHSTPIAKSAHRSPEQRRADRLASGLPRGWRHEQLSALLYAHDHAKSPGTEHELVLRLIGTSHGHGRHGFTHVAAGLLSATHADLGLAEHWFDDGGWDDLLETTHRRWGYWGCAYLESLLRAADSQISMEGS